MNLWIVQIFALTLLLFPGHHCKWKWTISYSEEQIVLLGSQEHKLFRVDHIWQINWESTFLWISRSFFLEIHRGEALAQGKKNIWQQKSFIHTTCGHVLWPVPWPSRSPNPNWCRISFQSWIHMVWWWSPWSTTDAARFLPRAGSHPPFCKASGRRSTPPHGTSAFLS